MVVVAPIDPLVVYLFCGSVCTSALTQGFAYCISEAEPVFPAPLFKDLVGSPDGCFLDDFRWRSNATGISAPVAPALVVRLIDGELGPLYRRC